MEEEREEGSVGRGLQDPPPGSSEVPQPSARLPALDPAPAHPGEPVGARGAPVEPGAPSSSAQPPRCPPLRSEHRARAHRAAGCPRSGAQQARGSSMPLLPSSPPPPRAPTDERQPHRDALSTERVPAGRGALLRPRGPESWEEWEGSPEGREGAPPA